MRFKRALAGAIIGGTGGFLFGAAATKILHEIEPSPPNASVAAQFSEELDSIETTLLVTLPALGGVALGGMAGVASLLEIESQSKTTEESAV